MKIFKLSKSAVILSISIFLGSCGSKSVDVDFQIPKIVDICVKKVVLKVPLGSAIGGHYDGIVKIRKNVYLMNEAPEVIALNYRSIMNNMIEQTGKIIRGDNYVLCRYAEPENALNHISLTVSNLQYNTYSPLAGNYTYVKMDLTWVLKRADTSEELFSLTDTVEYKDDGKYGLDISYKAVKKAFREFLSNDAFLSSLVEDPGLKQKRYDKASSHFMKGYENFELEKYDAAIREFKEVLKMQPNHEGSMNYIARSKELIQIRKQEKIALYTKNGNRYLKKKQYAAAIEEYKKLLAVSPEDLTAKQNIKYAQKCIRDIERSEKIQQLLSSADSYFDAALYAKASAEYSNVLNIDPDNSYAASKLQESKTAESNKNTAVEQRKRYEAAKKFFKDAKYEKALESFNKLLSENPDYPGASEYAVRSEEYMFKELEDNNIKEHLKRGKLFLAQMEYKKASAEFKSILEIRPSDMEASALLAEAESGASERSRTVDMGEMFSKGQASFKAGDYEHAINYFSEVLKIDPEHEDSLSYIKRAEAAMKKEKDAVLWKYFSRAHKLFSEKKYEESIAEFEKVLQVQPDHQESLKYIKRAEQALQSGK